MRELQRLSRSMSNQQQKRKSLRLKIWKTGTKNSSENTTRKIRLKMYNKKKLLKKIEGHFNGNMELLNALISDVDEFNSICNDNQIELYIDFDNESECAEIDTYETFSLVARFKKNNKTETLLCGLTLEWLDISLYVLIRYVNFCNKYSEMENYKEKCANLEAKINSLEDKSILNSILNS